MKSSLTLFPALALALLLTACGAPNQPRVPQTPISVERVLNETIQQDQLNNEMGDMNDSNEVNVELDAALDTLESELTAALNGDIEMEINEVLVEEVLEPEVMTEVEVKAQAETNAEPNPEPIIEENITTDTDGQVDIEAQNEEEELIDQPIIIE